MTPSPGLEYGRGVRRVIALFASLFVAAFTWIAFQKVVHLACAFAGLFGQIPAWKLAATIPLLFGGDVWSAAWVALASTCAAAPVMALAGPGPARAVAAALQGALAFLGVVSFFLMLTMGNALDKTLVDMVLLQAAHASAPGSLADSVGRYMTPLPLLFLGGSTVLAVAVSLRLSRTPVLARGDQPTPAPRSRAKVAIAAFLVLLAVVHVALMPGLKSRELVGEQLRTWGVDRSFPHDLVVSYGRAVLARLKPPDVVLADPFRMDLRSLANPAPLAAPPLQGAAPGRSNLVLVLFESVGAVYLERDPGLMPFVSGLPRARPGSASLAAHYTTWPQTTKALFSILCSEYPYPSYEPISVVNPAIPCACLPGVLKEAGYRTALFSSQDLTFDATHQFLRGRGFDVTRDMNDMPGAEGAWRTSWGLDDRATARLAARWAASDPRTPFFLLLQLVSGHHPYDVPPDANRLPPDASDRDRYLQSLRFLDAVVRDFLGELDRAGLAADTLVVVVSDHGEAFGQHPGDFGHGATVWEPAARVPVVLTGPQVGPVAGRVVAEPTSHVDLAPTLLALLGIEVPFTMKGRDLTASREARMVLIGGRPQASQFGVRDGVYKFVWTLETGTRELFDLSRDPAEARDIASSRPDLVERYARVIETWRVHSRHLIENYAEVVARTPRSRPRRSGPARAREATGAGRRGAPGCAGATGSR